MSLALKINTHSYCPLNPFVSIVLLLRVQLRDGGLIIRFNSYNDLRNECYLIQLWEKLIS